MTFLGLRGNQIIKRMGAKKKRNGFVNKHRGNGRRIGYDNMKDIMNRLNENEVEISIRANDESVLIKEEYELQDK